MCAIYRAWVWPIGRRGASLTNVRFQRCEINANNLFPKPSITRKSGGPQFWGLVCSQPDLMRYFLTMLSATELIPWSNAGRPSSTVLRLRYRVTGRLRELHSCSSFDVSSCTPGCCCAAGSWCEGCLDGSVPRELSEKFLLLNEPSEKTRSSVWCVSFWPMELKLRASFSLLLGKKCLVRGTRTGIRKIEVVPSFYLGAGQRRGSLACLAWAAFASVVLSKFVLYSRRSFDRWGQLYM